MSTELKNLSQTGELPSGEGKNFIIVVSEWNDGITSALLEGAMDTLKKAGAPEQNIRTLKVPGCFELPYAAQEAALSYKPHAVICLGCVIKGETPHFDYVCQAATQGILQASLHTHIPVIFGVLTVNSLEQAQDRAGGKYGNKGVEAALTALKMTNLRNLLR